MVTEDVLPAIGDDRLTVAAQTPIEEERLVAGIADQQRSRHALQEEPLVTFPIRRERPIQMLPPAPPSALGSYATGATLVIRSRRECLRSRTGFSGSSGNSRVPFS